MDWKWQEMDGFLMGKALPPGLSWAGVRKWGSGEEVREMQVFSIQPGSTSERKLTACKLPLRNMEYYVGEKRGNLQMSEREGWVSWDKSEVSYQNK